MVSKNFWFIARVHESNFGKIIFRWNILENLMINDLKWVKWIDEYITLTMNDPFMLMFNARKEVLFSQ